MNNEAKKVLRCSGEDWSAVDDPKQRKKLQNRINQRVRRQRHLIASVRISASQSPYRDEESDVLALANSTRDNIHAKRATLSQRAMIALVNYHSQQPPAADQLLQVVQLNVINSLTRNAAILGVGKDWLLCECISPFAAASRSDFAQLPAHLQPTELQLLVPHHPWIDLFPIPHMRDNFLKALQGVRMPAPREQILWDDMIESCSSCAWRGLVVWGDPWDPRSWEATPAFLKRWQWLLEGCAELLAATNYWRHKRGEEPLLSQKENMCTAREN